MFLIQKKNNNINTPIHKFLYIDVHTMNKNNIDIDTNN
jgi:hypothetical protein